MDSPTRNFLALAGIGALFGTYAVWGFLAYVLIPLVGAADLPAAVSLVPATMSALLLVISLALGAGTLRRVVSASRRLSRRIEADALPPSPRLRAAAESVGLEGRVGLLDAADPFSFAYGLLVPRVVISRGFLERLTDEELGAALEHECYHVRNLDPLRALIAAVLSDAFFLLPSLAVLRRRYEAGRELAADQWAEGICGARPLLGALLKALQSPGSEPTVAASLAATGLLHARVSRLETGLMPPLPAASFSSLAWSTLGAGAFLFALLAAMIGVGGTSALAGAASYELSGAGISLDALCLAPIVALASSYRRLARRASHPPAAILGQV